ncbi:cupin domain-containing protein [Duganella callida]|uniref:Cupin domain-containing protein n=1 Tax=Duganella callida TaxID=2561932 RepID=A0A4Y9ST72_9BURK|nr:cupin domain-containing protein [Duganella callida]TFW29648.1 cupin domain-containing protein [Duganella callida]
MKTNQVVLILVLAGAAGFAASQTSGIRRNVIQKADVSVPGREAVVAKVEVDAGGSSGRHTHPGDEIAYILEGEGELLVDGEDPRRVKAGESYVIPAGTIHDAINSGKTPLRLVGVYVVDKGKPLATPAK